MKQSAVRIEHDLFGIADRLRAIDEGYFVVYDTQKHAFEVHNRSQRGNTYALTVPYPCLDARTVTLVRRTRAENARRLFAEMEEENQKRAAAQARSVAEKAAQATERALR